jgi:phage regulator Rha-like protein
MKTKGDYPDETILKQIYMIRDQRIMFDFDLAELYGVETKQLKRAVRRHIDRFPEDFMFEIGLEEFENQRCQIGTFNALKYRPFCFTEQGVTMLACVLNSLTAIQMNIRIIRLFSKMREALSTQKEIIARLELIERHVGDHNKDLSKLFEAIHLLLSREEIRMRTNEIGFTKTRD